MSDRFTHFDADGRAAMVDVAAKDETDRIATARARIVMAPATLEKIRAGGMGKGDVLGIARIAGIMGAKRTSDLIPLCHPLMLTKVSVEFTVSPPDSVEIEATARTLGRTGVEMEALTGASVGALAIIDMVKGVDRMAAIDRVELLEKSGGRSGTWTRP